VIMEPNTLRMLSKQHMIRQWPSTATGSLEHFAHALLDTSSVQYMYLAEVHVQWGGSIGVSRVGVVVTICGSDSMMST
jgi:hypothetical protein